MSKGAHATKLAYLRKLCTSAESMHIETARLVKSLTNEPRYTRSTASLRPKPQKAKP